MDQRIVPPELLAPAGTPEKLRYAIHYGADAVYLAGSAFGMRSAAGNFTDEELLNGIKYAHDRGKKVYLTVNTMPRCDEFDALGEFIHKVSQMRPDAFIVADAGVFDLCRTVAPDIPIHISTQGANVNHRSCLFWYRLGAKRIVLARELSLKEIVFIRQNTPKDLELEVFVHGAMCVSFSGRCLLSEYYTGRDANRGSCTQPCRWIYNFSEVKRPDEVLEAQIHPEGTYIFGSKDMCLIEHIPELCRAGINCFKIEGRMKSSYYTAAVTNAYRIELDRFLKAGEEYVCDPRSVDELSSVSHREYCTGYFFTHPLSEPNLASTPGYMKEKSYLALVESKADNGLVKCRQKNKLILGTNLEYITPGSHGKKLTVEQLFNEDLEPIESTPHPQMIFYVKTPDNLKPGDIIRSAE